MTYRYFIKLSYHGGNYHGWQIQPNAPTIQEVLNQDFSLLLGEEIKVTGCGRTDTGVHAKLFYAHFDSESKNLERDPDFVYKINGKLPADISIQEVLKVKADAHSRFDAISRSYEYHIQRTKEVFQRDQSHIIFGELDTKAMQSAAEILKEFSDFTSFSKVDTDVKTNNCKIYDASWDFSYKKMVFSITADRFLRNMVRAIVGTLIEVGFRKINLEEFRQIIESRNRSNAGTSAPAKGLFLTDVRYPPELFLSDQVIQ
ncbi:MAG TPA: tRNA pseudouridine(38-40) synthase TruA [Bacteroides sp.]|nr:tRNA pseudouridine(38-40) synthase TruA [Bacteroides sp.]